MKTLITLIAVLGLTPLFSCTKVLYTHESVMARYHTQDDVSKQFGIPAERLTDTATEQWLYNFQKVPGQHGLSADFIAVKHASTHDVQSFSRYERFIIFQFDKKGDLIQTFNKDVDFTKTKVSGGKTAGLIAGLAGGTVLILWLISSNSGPGSPYFIQ